MKHLKITVLIFISFLIRINAYSQSDQIKQKLSDVKDAIKEQVVDMAMTNFNNVVDHFTVIVSDKINHIQDVVSDKVNRIINHSDEQQVDQPVSLKRITNVDSFLQNTYPVFYKAVLYERANDKVVNDIYFGYADENKQVYNVYGDRIFFNLSSLQTDDTYNQDFLVCDLYKAIGIIHMRSVYIAKGDTIDFISYITNDRYMALANDYTLSLQKSWVLNGGDTSALYYTVDITYRGGASVNNTLNDSEFNSCAQFVKYQPQVTIFGKENYPTTLATEGWRSYEAGNVDDCIDKSKQALSMQDNYLMMWVRANLGLCYLTKGDIDSSNYWYQIIIDEDDVSSSITAVRKINNLIDKNPKTTGAEDIKKKLLSFIYKHPIALIQHF